MPRRERLGSTWRFRPEWRRNTDPYRLAHRRAFPVAMNLRCIVRQTPGKAPELYHRSVRKHAHLGRTLVSKPFLPRSKEKPLVEREAADRTPAHDRFVTRAVPR